MAKICICDGCDSLVFGGGYCKYHQYLRLNKSIQTSSVVKRYNIPKRTSKAFRYNFWGYNTQIDMFRDIWDNSVDNHGNRYCWLTGKKLPKQFNLCYFAHVLPKKNYKLWKLNPYNIKLLLPNVHSLVDEFKSDYYGIYPDIDFNKWFNLQFEYKKEYKEDLFNKLGK